MTRILMIVFSALAGAVRAESYLCVSEAGAGVEHGGPNGMKAAVYDVSNKKFVQTNESGEWVVKPLGSEAPLFDYCSSPHFCEHKEMYSGTFIRGNDGIFTVIWFSGHDSTIATYVATGRCSKI